MMKWKLTVLTVLVLSGAVGAIAYVRPFLNNDRSLKLPGVVEVDEIRLGSKVGGRVAKTLIDEGQRVKEGQELMIFEAPELKAQRDQIQARLDAAKSELVKSENGPREQERAAAKAALKAAEARLALLYAGSRAEEIERAEAELLAVVALRNYTARELNREERLQRGRASDESRLEKARADHHQAKEKARAALAHLKLLKAGARTEEIAEGKAEVARLKANLDLIQAGTRYEDVNLARAKVQELDAKLREINTHLKEASLIAPDDLLIEVLSAHRGDLVEANQPVIRALRANSTYIKVFVPETELGNIKVGQSVTVTVDSHRNREFPGTVMHIASISEFTPRNVQTIDERRHQVHAVKVKVADHEGIFKAGMAAQVKLPLVNAE